MEYFKDDQRMPIYLSMHPDLKEIFNAYTGGVNNRMVCQKMSPLSKAKGCLYLRSKYLPYSPPISPSTWKYFRLPQT